MNCVGVYESTGKTIAEIQAEAKARLPVFTPLYTTSKFFNILARCYQLDQSFNCHTFIQKYDLVKKRYIGGWIK